MIPTCPGPLASVSTPSWRPPAAGVDCHMHVFGPYDRYPLSSGRSYTPPAAGLAAYRSVRRTLGLERTVVVQPSVYGDDNTVTLDAASALGPGPRAVVVVGVGVSDAELRAMGERRACAVRFNAVSGNGTPLVHLEALAARLRFVDWHVEIYCRGDQLVDLEPIVTRLPVPVVFDHLGGVCADDGVSGDASSALIRMLRRGAWTKLCGYRGSSGHPYEDVAPIVRAVVDAAPSRCVWGTDWPHPALRSPDVVPDDGRLLDALAAWVPDARQRRAILVENPATLYRF
jgi:predicted TIM-barrel fold metal-dependent hydrolase